MPGDVFSTSGLKLELEEKPEETIVYCHGRVVADSAQWFQETIRDRIIPMSRGKGVAVTSRIVLDLSHVSFIDSTGLGSLLTVWTAAQRRGCDMEIVNPGARVEEVLSITKLDQVFNKMKNLFGGNHGK